MFFRPKEGTQEVIQIIQDLCTNTTTSGIRQGDLLSPVIFNSVMKKLIDSAKIMVGYGMGRKELNILRYVDDADSEDNLHKLLQNCEHRQYADFCLEK